MTGSLSSASSHAQSRIPAECCRRRRVRSRERSMRRIGASRSSNMRPAMANVNVYASMAWDMRFHSLGMPMYPNMLSLLRP